MSAFYDKDIDYLEVIREKCQNYSVEKTDSLQVFLSEEDGHVVGFGLEAAKESLADLLFLDDEFLRLAGLTKLTRESLKLSQEKFAEKADIGLRTLQRVEGADATTNLTFNNTTSISELAYKAGLDFSIVFKKTQKIS